MVKSVFGGVWGFSVGSSICSGYLRMFYIAGSGIEGLRVKLVTRSPGVHKEDIGSLQSQGPLLLESGSQEPSLPTSRTTQEIGYQDANLP